MRHSLARLPVIAVVALALGALANLGAASDARADATCQDPAQLLLAAANEAVRAAWGTPKAAQAAKVAGVELTDDPRLLAHVKRLLGDTPPAAWSKKPAGCSKALCALANALDGSQEAAAWALAIGADGGPVASLDQAPFKGVVSAWHAAELRILARALGDLPPGLKKQATKLSAFRRLPDGQDPYGGANGYSTRDGVIFLRDTVWKLPARQQREVIAHEFGHEIEFGKGSGYPISHAAEWLGFSGWELVGKDPNAKGAFRIPGSDATATAIPSEQFPNTIADYRYTPRLLRSDSKGRYAFVQKMYGGQEYLKPAADPGVDAALAKLDGPLAVFSSECGALVQRTSWSLGWMQPELYLVRWKKTGGSSFLKVAQGSLVTRSPCLGMVLDKLRETAEWKALACTRDEEELAQAVAARLEDVSGAYAEAVAQIKDAVPAGTREACVRRGDLGIDCLAGAKGRAAASTAATKINLEFHPGRAQGAEELGPLANQLLARTALAPTDEELFEKFPVLASPTELFGACLGGVIEVSTPSGKPEWKYWVKNPPANDVRGFTSPIWTKACPRDFAAHLKASGVQLDVDDPLFEHLTYMLKNQVGPLVERFKAGVLDQWPALRSACGMPANTKATAAQQPCAAAFIEPKLAGLVPPALAPRIAKLLAAQLRGP